jgi:septal ring factor EnvC (AmiA/AmiB activator)
MKMNSPAKILIILTVLSFFISCGRGKRNPNIKLAQNVAEENQFNAEIAELREQHSKLEVEIERYKTLVEIEESKSEELELENKKIEKRYQEIDKAYEEMMKEYNEVEDDADGEKRKRILAEFRRNLKKFRSK